MLLLRLENKIRKLLGKPRKLVPKEKFIKWVLVFTSHVIKTTMQEDVEVAIKDREGNPGELVAFLTFTTCEGREFEAVIEDFWVLTKTPEETAKEFVTMMRGKE